MTPVPSSLQNRTFHVITFGCQMNKHDSERIVGMLEAEGARRVDSIEESEIVVYMTCCVRAAAETRLKGQVASLKNIELPAHSDLEERIVCIGGCIGQHEGEHLIEELPHVSAVFGTFNLSSVPSLLKQAIAGHTAAVEVLDAADEFPTCLPTSREVPWSAWLPISIGCNNFCTYCIVPYTRGRERSRDIESILNEIRDMRDKGFKEVTLLGQNVNSYLFEKEGEKISFPVLLKRVAEEVPEMRVRFTTSHPKDMSDETLHVIAEHDNICKMIHLPAQSGSSRILKVMNRKYTREWYLDRIAAIRRILPDCAISTDLFCGFHSETEEDYQETLSLMREVGYDSAFLFKYSERPGTYAAQHLPDTVSEEEKVRRLQGMIDLQNQLSEESNKRDIGKVFEVLIEGFSKRSREQLFGRTSQNKVVIFDKKNYHVGQFIKVRINRASSATLFGDPVE